MRFTVVVSDRFSIGFVQENQRRHRQRKRRILAGGNMSSFPGNHVVAAALSDRAAILIGITR
jgi:hypothetical protein